MTKIYLTTFFAVVSVLIIAIMGLVIILVQKNEEINSCYQGLLNIHNRLMDCRDTHWFEKDINESEYYNCLRQKNYYKQEMNWDKIQIYKGNATPPPIPESNWQQANYTPDIFIER
jgi:hypothetical protein